MRYFYYAVDEFGDKMRRFENRNYALSYIAARPGWSLIREPRIIVPVIDWNNFELATF